MVMGAGQTFFICALTAAFLVDLGGKEGRDLREDFYKLMGEYIYLNSPQTFFVRISEE